MPNIACGLGGKDRNARWTWALKDMLVFTRDFEAAPLSEVISSAVERIARWLEADYVCLHFDRPDDLDGVVAEASLRLCAGRLVSNTSALERQLVTLAKSSGTLSETQGSGPIRRAFALPLRYFGGTYAVVNVFYLHETRPPAQPALDAVAYLGRYLLAGIKRRIADRDGYEHGYFVRMLAGLTGIRSPSMAKHADRVLHYAEKLALAVGLDADELRVTRRAALLHDIGKIGVPDALLNKPDELSERERFVVQLHPRIEERFLTQLPGALMRSVAAAVAAHHERIDGTGYPRGLRSHEIPKAARIIAICEAFDVMTADCVYKRTMSRTSAMMELKANAGRQFDSEFVEAFQQKRCFELDPKLALVHRDEL